MSDNYHYIQSKKIPLPHTHLYISDYSDDWAKVPESGEIDNASQRSLSVFIRSTEVNILWFHPINISGKHATMCFTIRIKTANSYRELSNNIFDELRKSIYPRHCSVDGM